MGCTVGGRDRGDKKDATGQGKNKKKKKPGGKGGLERGRSRLLRRKGARNKETPSVTGGNANKQAKKKGGKQCHRRANHEGTARGWGGFALVFWD